MTAQFARPQQRGRSGTGQAHEPHAALLIDFDNVTMGIRSDLTKELKNLLNSDIIKGKVAVQRAYADWRRYPQYIVPLAESSVDLIFAPAYGSAKKNATDIRLAIDAIELVFTRPEIGTIILLSGDSDFSSMVLKLKEYGKYVIGVGIRESASDLLVQNCDEYYSYSALTGLTRAGDETPVVSEDPWELIEMALRQMRDNNDVMRSDRLKQVLLELDPSFDEKALGFQKFNKFLQEAATRGLLSLRKQDNGQFEIGPPDAAATADAQADARGEARRGRGRRGRGRREEGRRDEGREPRREAPIAGPALAAAPVAAEAPAPVAPAERPKPQPAAAAATERPKPQPEPVKPVIDIAAAVLEATRPAAEAPPAAAAPRAEPVAPSKRSEQPRPERAAAAPEPSRPPAGPPLAPAEAARPKDVRPGAAAGDLAASYDLLRRAASDLVKKSGQAARDSDVKRRMLELESGWDESVLGFSKFSRFLRQAHDAEVITLRKGDNGVFDVLPGNGEAGRSEAPERDRERGRGRGRGRDRDRGVVDGARPAVAAAPRDSGADVAAAEAPKARAAGAPSERAPAAAAPPVGAQPAARAPGAAPEAGQKKGPAPSPAAPAARPVSAAPAQPAGQKGAPAQPAALMFRRGSRGRGAPTGPPPLLEGQAAGVRAAPPSAVADRVPPPPTAAAAPAAPAAAPPRERPAPDSSIAAELGLPQQPDEVASYIAANYRGVGPKSVQTLIEEFGAARVFDALEKLPDRVRELLGAGRGDRLLAAWKDDLAGRRASGARPAAKAPAKSSARKAPSKRPSPAKAAKSATRGTAAKTPATAKSATARAAAAPLQTGAPAAKQSVRSRGGRAAGRDRPPAK